MATVRSVCIFKKKKKKSCIKIHLFLSIDSDTEGMKQYFLAYYAFLYLRKVKMWLECKKICVFYREAIMNDQIYSKWFTMFYAENFSLNYGRERLIKIKTLRTISIKQHGRYPNQALKIICTNLVMLISIQYSMFWKQILMGDKMEPTLTIPKAIFDPKKVSWSSWWNWKGLFYYQLKFLENKMIDLNKNNLKQQLTKSINNWLRERSYYSTRIILVTGQK